MSDGHTELVKEARRSKKIMIHMAKVLKILADKFDEKHLSKDCTNLFLQKEDLSLSKNEQEIVEKLISNDSSSWVTFVYTLQRETYFLEGKNVFLFLNKIWPFKGNLIAIGIHDQSTKFNPGNTFHYFGSKEFINTLLFSRKLVEFNNKKQGYSFYLVFLNKETIDCYFSN